MPSGIFQVVLAFRTISCFQLHKSQNTLDLVITHENVNIVSNFVQGEMISDHFAVLFDLHIPSRPKQEKIIRFRQVKDIDVSKFATDLQAVLVPLYFYQSV